MYLQLLIIAAIPGIVSCFAYYIQKKETLKNCSYALKQTTIGIIFGIIACLGTAYGVNVGGALANTRDAAIICAGLLFGGPAGIIAGFIGGFYRWIAVYWGAGEFTRVACSVACILSGFYAAFLRKYMFDHKLPGWIIGLFLGGVMEVVHVNLLFLTNTDNLEKTLKVLDALTIPMVICNAVGVALPLLVITLISGESLLYNKKKYKAKISQTIQKWLLGTILVALILSTFFTFSLQTGIAKSDAITITKNTLIDIKNDIKDASDENLLRLTNKVASKISLEKDLQNINPEQLFAYAVAYDVDEISIINSDGIIISSTNRNYINFDMSSGEQSKEFLSLLTDKREYVQEYSPVSYDSSIYMKYAGVRIKGTNFVQVGYNSTRFKTDLKKRITLAATNRHIESTGYVIIFNDKFEVESHSNKSDLEYLSDSDIPDIYKNIIDGQPELTMINSNILNRDVYCMYTTSEGYYIVGVYPVEEANFIRNVALYANVFIEIIIFGVLFALIYILIRVIVVNNIYKIIQSLAEITDGNLNAVVNVRSNEEFSVLSNDINSTVDTLKRYISEAASRIDAELQYAKDIQASALPHIEPNFINQKAYDLNASMYTAKEVGGDFYDFYYSDDSHLVLTIADVSGKGIPAALFMMTSKTMLRNMVESGMSVDTAMTTANQRLCENNDANMFVTSWSAIVDLKTGHIDFANAGHNPPVIKKKNGCFEYVKCKAGFVLAGMDTVKYKPQELEIEPGDILYLYTDGVTEATDANSELYGEDRLLNILNSIYTDDLTMKELCDGVKADVDKFVGDAPQFDDITMIAFKYNGFFENESSQNND